LDHKEKLNERLQSRVHTWYKSLNRAMVELFRPFLADFLLNGMATLGLGLVSYLVWLRFRERREERKAQRERERNRRGHWGYL